MGFVEITRCDSMACGRDSDCKIITGLLLLKSLILLERNSPLQILVCKGSGPAGRCIRMDSSVQLYIVTFVSVGLGDPYTGKQDQDLKGHTTVKGEERKDEIASNFFISSGSNCQPFFLKSFKARFPKVRERMSKLLAIFLSTSVVATENGFRDCLLTDVNG